MSNPTELEEDSRIRVLLVHNHEAFLRVATEFLQRHHELVVVGTARGGEEALAQAQELRPEVVLIDLRMPGLNGMATIPRLRVMLPETGIIALTLLDPNTYRQTALAAGADDFVAKANLSTDLLPAIRRVAKTARIGHEPSDFRRYTKRKDKRKTKSQLIADGQQKQNPQGGETMKLGIVGRPYPGETVSGDACFAREYEGKTLIAVVDGLGHGQRGGRQSGGHSQSQGAPARPGSHGCADARDKRHRYHSPAQGRNARAQSHHAEPFRLQEYREAAMASGATGYVVKKSVLEELVPAIGGALGAYRRE